LQIDGADASEFDVVGVDLGFNTLRWDAKHCGVLGGLTESGFFNVEEAAFMRTIGLWQIVYTPMFLINHYFTDNSVR
jgi:hypothetical protein